VSKFKSLLEALKVFEQETLSISNLLVLAIIIKSLLVSQIEVPLVVLVFLVLTNYNLKKFFAYKTQRTDEKIGLELSKLKEEVSSLISASQFRKMGK
jgi:hypothetical protein